jgi:hypothetical protein
MILKRNNCIKVYVCEKERGREKKTSIAKYCPNDEILLLEYLR